MNMTSRFGLLAVALSGALMQTACVDTGRSTPQAGTLRIENHTTSQLTVIQHTTTHEVAPGARQDLTMSAADVQVKATDASGTLTNVTLTFNPGNCAAVMCLLVK